MTTSEPLTVFSSGEARRDDVSPITISFLKEGGHDRWDAFVLGQQEGSLFHQTPWMRVIEKTYGYKPYYLYAERDGRIAGVAPCFLVSNWISGRCLISVPFAVYGGMCADSPDAAEALAESLERLAEKLRVEHVELRSRNSAIRPGYVANTRYSTFTISLTKDIRNLQASLPKDVRYMIRKAEKAGLRAERGLHQIEDFYKLLTVNLRRLGTPAFPKGLFQNLISELKDQVQLTVIYSGGKPVAGGMSFCYRDWMQPYYVGSLDEAKGLAANDFLWWKLVEQAAESGYRTFDFGRSKNDSGNFAFKKKWNPRIEPLDYQVRLVQRKDVPNFSPANRKFRAATNVWKRLPLGLTRKIGPRIVRWFP